MNNNIDDNNNNENIGTGNDGNINNAAEINPNNITIPKRQLTNDEVSIIIYGIWSGFYLRDWIDLKKSLKHGYTSNLLFLFMIVVFFKFLINVKNRYVHGKLLGLEITYDQYQRKINLGSVKFARLCWLMENMSSFVQMLLVDKFIPFTKHNCYEYNEGLCTSGRVGAFFGIILIIGYCVMAAVLFLVLIIVCCNPQILQALTMRDVVTRAQRTPILNQLPIFQHIVLENEECPICMQSGEEGGDNNFIVLTCNHKFHDSCIRQWVSTGANLNCPTCREPIRLDALQIQQPNQQPNQPLNQPLNQQQYQWQIYIGDNNV